MVVEELLGVEERPEDVLESLAAGRGATRAEGRKGQGELAGVGLADQGGDEEAADDLLVSEGRVLEPLLQQAVLGGELLSSVSLW